MHFVALSNGRFFNLDQVVMVSPMFGGLALLKPDGTEEIIMETGDVLAIRKVLEQNLAA